MKKNPARMPVKPTAWLASLEFHGVKLGLENITLLLDALGNPQDCLPIFHIAGTNGKGSVTAFLDSMLRAAGYRTGRFTSPHLVQVNERFIIDGAPIDDAKLDGILTRIQSTAESMPRCPTYFETTTAVALTAFADAGVEAAILETGLGGRFDATNVVSPIATGIGPIALDHTQYLGDTLEAIAFEKAGIIKPDIPVSVSVNVPEALGVIERKAADVNAPMRRAMVEYRYEDSGDALSPRMDYRGDRFEFSDAPLGLAGIFQAGNAALAVSMIESAVERFGAVDEATVVQGLADARWPCRLERVLDAPAVYIDVAHNPAGAKALAASIPRSVIVIAVSDDKDGGAIAEALAPKAVALIVTEYEGRRALSAADLSQQLESMSHESVASMEQAIERAMEIAEDRPIVIAGSIFAAGQARTFLEEKHGGAPLRF